MGGFTQTMKEAMLNRPPHHHRKTIDCRTMS